MAAKVYIDGQEGTTGLKILERFNGRTDIEILKIDPEKRKDNDERKKMINSSDFTILCLPDAASIEAVSFIENNNTRIIDASTAHRTNPDWAYGFPELSAEHREKIAASKRVAVPGCYASGFLSMVFPLVKSGILPADYPVTVHAVSGYSGAGKKGIAQYEDSERAKEFDTPRQYALTQSHKHLPEMQIISGLQYKPMFNPYVCDYFAGMVVSLPLHTRLLGKKVTPADVKAMFDEHYNGSNFIKVTELNGADILTN
ncbi:MAG: N-acetyl-gamma-glutamyl-phosphate reductase, partial [Oscillospiraceae bacterium]|nr:N-acetyl-gamma-glutamyl-phosphate reductase [Oscillospiraceae bacterium]